MSELSFFTFFSKEYLPRAELLHRSLLSNENHLTFSCCVLDAKSAEFAESLCNSSYFSFSEVLEENALLDSVVRMRKGADAIFSAVPAMIKKALAGLSENDLLVYLDADTVAFSDFKRISETMKGYSIGLFPHDFIRPLHLIFNRYGEFNAGAIVVRNNHRGRRFLDEWERLCIAWCEDRVLRGNYSNQAYLTHLWRAQSEGIVILRGIGGNVAPWNSGLLNTKLTEEGLIHRGNRLVFFHFHAITFSPQHWTVGHLRYMRVLGRKQIDAIYGKYVLDLETAHRKHQIALKRSERFGHGFGVHIFESALTLVSILLNQRTKRQIQ